MPGEVIPLVRVKLLDRGELPARLRPADKAVPKGMRLTRPPWRLAGREMDGVVALAAHKVAHRIKRAPKMRLFRSFKLFTTMKRQPGITVAAGQPVVVAGLRVRVRSGKFR
jgi:hypothetical protein